MGRNGVRAPLRTPACQANVLATLQQTLIQSLFVCFGGEKKIGGLVEARAGSHWKGRRENRVAIFLLSLPMRPRARLNQTLNLLPTPRTHK